MGYIYDHVNVAFGFLASATRNIVLLNAKFLDVCVRVMMANYGDAHKSNDATYYFVLQSCTNLNTLKLGEGTKSQVLCSSDHMGYILKGNQLSHTMVISLNVALINSLGFTNDCTSRRNEVPACNLVLFATWYGLESLFLFGKDKFWINGQQSPCVTCWFLKSY